MPRKAKTTKRVRMKLDVVIDFDTEFNSFPVAFGGPKDLALVQRALALAVFKSRKHADIKPVYLHVTSAEFGCDFRKPTPSQPASTKTG